MKKAIYSRRVSSTVKIVQDGKTKYETTVDPRDKTLASHRCASAFRKGAGVRG